MSSVYAELARRAAAGETCALATVVATIGSSPAQSAMKMIVGLSGRLSGTIGGGRVEAAVEAAGREAIERGTSRMLSFTLDDDLADEGGMICGGTVRILVERVEPPAPWAAIADECTRTGRRAALLASIGERVERSILLDAKADPYLSDPSPRLVNETLFVEPLFRPRCILLGAGHVGRSVARIAREAGFHVAAVEDREEQAARIGAEVDEVLCEGLVEGFAKLRPIADDFVLILTRSHGLDLECARAALNSPARYVGMLASSRKAGTIRSRLEKDGLDAGRLAAPVGLDVGAVSAGEIAVSIVAQLIRAKRIGRAGG